MRADELVTKEILEAEFLKFEKKLVGYDEKVNHLEETFDRKMHKLLFEELPKVLNNKYAEKEKLRAALE